MSSDKYVLAIWNRRTGSMSLQELPERNPIAAIERIASVAKVARDTTWEVVAVPSTVRGRDVTRKAEEIIGW